jgi:hypothetical protein
MCEFIVGNIKIKPGGVTMEQWEYKTIKVELKGLQGGILKVDEFNSELNFLGEAGWELVSCFSTTGGAGYGREAIAVLKRRKS